MVYTHFTEGETKACQGYSQLRALEHCMGRDIFGI